jgi:uncharacterized membrane protein YkoI
MKKKITKARNIRKLIQSITYYWVSVFALVFVASTSLFADISQSAARKLRASGQIMPLEKIHEKANLIKSGKILETELEIKNGRYVYEVELLETTGLVWEIKLDAKTGELIELEED